MSLNLFKNKIFIRIIHGTLVLIFTLCIIELYYCAITDTVGNILYITCTILFLEGAALIINKGRCPLEYAHKKAGDAEGFFDLLFPTYLVPYVIPVVAILVAVGFLWLYL